MDQISITEKQLAGKPRRVGTLKGDPVFLLATRGGLHVVAAKKKLLGVGPHPAVAKHIAEKREPEIVFDALQKGDLAEYQDYAVLLPLFEAETERFCLAQTLGLARR